MRADWSFAEEPLPLGLDQDGDLVGLPDSPETQLGDVWELGRHRVVCADAFAFDARGFNGGPVDLIVTDPPYAIFGSSTGVGSDVADDRMVRPFFASLARRAVAALPVNGHAYVFCDWRSWAALWDGFRSGGLAVRNMIVWDKGGGRMGPNFENRHELIAFSHNVPRTSNTFKTTRAADGYRPVYASNVLRVPRVPAADREHNAAKPVVLLESLIRNSVEALDDPVILDLFAGSGSTLIAAENLGHRSIAVEIEPAWCDVIVARWQSRTGGTAQRMPGAAEPWVRSDWGAW